MVDDAARVENVAGLRVRVHGAHGPPVFVLHGGPAAAGEAEPLARGLADRFRAIEPWQRGSGAEPLTVARHVADLRELVATFCGATRPALVGESWGAMLALAYAAAHPRSAGPLVLVGCGTFDEGARAKLRETLAARLDAGQRDALARLETGSFAEERRLALRLELTRGLLDCDAEPAAPEPSAALDARAHLETWNDMLRLQREGVYPAAFAAIQSPVLMLHGAEDPHPGPLIHASLAPQLPQLEYREFPRCGHNPWRERAARAQFFVVLKEWLTRRLAGRAEM